MLARNLGRPILAARNAKITTLPNRVRVATEQTPGHFTSVGVYIDAGSRYECAANSGSSHFLDRMAFKTTTNMTQEQMTSAIDSLGGQIMCASSREAIMYQASHLGTSTPTAVSLIADNIKAAQYLPEELDAVRESTRYEIRELQAKPEMILPEVLHGVAYGGTGLGNPLVCPEERIDLINGDTLRHFVEQWYRPERIVVAGAGVAHDELVDLTLRHFSFLLPPTAPSISKTNTRQAGSLPSMNTSHLAAFNPPAQIPGSRAASSFNSLPTFQQPPTHYTGGHHFIPDKHAPLTHVYLAFEGLPINDPDIYALATIQFVLGGGGSFSAGGPGKGMYSRLYSHILNHHPEIDHCAAFHHIYSDSSLFGVFASFFTPGSNEQIRGATAQQVLPHLIHQFSLLLYTDIGTVELERSKNQLKSSLVMALESRAIEVEDLGRQVLVHGRKIPVADMCDRIDMVTPSDIRRVSHRIFGEACLKPLSVVVQGEEDLQDAESVLRKYGVGGSSL